MNRWRRFAGWIYVPCNLAFTAALLGAVAGPGKLTLSEAGLTEQTLGSLPSGLALGLIPVGAMALLMVSDRGRRLLADPRFAGLSRRDALFAVLVKIPLGTAVVEEVLFRGVLLGLLAPRGTTQAVAFSSAVFGLWHVMPTINRVRAGNPRASAANCVRVVAAAVLLSTAAGVSFALLRMESGNLGVPVGFHAAINSGGALLAFAADRRIRRDQPAAGPSCRQVS
ncbi:MAG: lysostaphin resistance A-like protein [Actinomycetota bacterium]